MSVKKREGSPFYYYEFKLGGRRFFGSTKERSRKRAEEVEREFRAAKAAEVAAQEKAKHAPLTFDAAALRYWEEVGRHHKRSDQTKKALAWLLAEIGTQTLLTEISNSDVARMVAKRRGDVVVNVARDGQASKRRKASATAAKRVSPARVNRSVTEPLRKVLLWAKKAWGAEVAEINWKVHILKEPRERVRSLTTEEERRLFDALPQQFHSIITFMLRMGARESEACGLTWPKLDLVGRTVTIFGKGSKEVTIPIPDDVRDLLANLAGDRQGRVFRYENGQPITVPGLVSAFRRARTAAGVADFRVHDLRHTAATRLLKDAGNLKMVSKLLRHEDLKTTAKYAHVFDEDLREAMNRSYQKRQAPAAEPVEAPSAARAAAE